MSTEVEAEVSAPFGLLTDPAGSINEFGRIRKIVLVESIITVRESWMQFRLSENKHPMNTWIGIVVNGVKLYGGESYLIQKGNYEFIIHHKGPTQNPPVPQTFHTVGQISRLSRHSPSVLPLEDRIA